MKQNADFDRMPETKLNEECLAEVSGGKTSMSYIFDEIDGLHFTKNDGEPAPVLCFGMHPDMYTENACIPLMRQEDIDAVSGATLPAAHRNGFFVEG